MASEPRTVKGPRTPRVESVNVQQSPFDSQLMVETGGPVSGGVMYKLDQMQLVCDIGTLLADQHGVVNVSVRHINAIIDAANRLCDEFNRNDVTAVAGAGLGRTECATILLTLTTRLTFGDA